MDEEDGKRNQVRKEVRGTVGEEVRKRKWKKIKICQVESGGNQERSLKM